MSKWTGYQSISRANRTKPVMERIFDKITPEPNTGCWLWCGCADKDGYGFVRVDGKNKKVHRVIFERHNGSINAKTLVCHTCDTPSCVNPLHLYAGTNSDNQIDAAIRQRAPCQKLSVRDVLEIRERRASGETATSLAKEFGVHLTTIINIAHRQKWKHV